MRPEIASRTARTMATYPVGIEEFEAAWRINPRGRPWSKPMKPIKWDICREGRQWSNEEFDQRIDQAPEKI
jgi:hypothetical protein